MCQQNQAYTKRQCYLISKAYGSPSVKPSWSSTLALNGSNLEATQKQSSNYQLLDEYAVWFVNWR
jgi:hypothetical protein